MSVGVPPKAIHNARAVQFSIAYWACVVALLAAVAAYVSVWLAALLAFIAVVADGIRRSVRYIGHAHASLSDGTPHPDIPWLHENATKLVLLDKASADALRR